MKKLNIITYSLLLVGLMNSSFIQSGLMSSTNANKDIHWKMFPEFIKEMQEKKDEFISNLDKKIREIKSNVNAPAGLADSLQKVKEKAQSIIQKFNVNFKDLEAEIKSLFEQIKKTKELNKDNKFNLEGLAPFKETMK